MHRRRQLGKIAAKERKMRKKGEERIGINLLSTN